MFDLSSLLHAAAEFSIYTVATVTEIDSTFMVCSVITITPLSATLASDVELSLTTVDGTGKSCFFNFRANVVLHLFLQRLVAVVTTILSPVLSYFQVVLLIVKKSV